jgi:alkyl hydroperoxide reductase subunit AhpF
LPVIIYIYLSIDSFLLFSIRVNKKQVFCIFHTASQVRAAASNPECLPGLIPAPIDKVIKKTAVNFIVETRYDADVLVAGGGPAGAACAYHLAKAG